MRIKLLYFSILVAFQAYCSAAVKEEGYTPWYTGSLLTISPANLMPGTFNVQPYLFILNNYGQYSSSSPSSNLNICLLNVFQFGLLNWLDFTITPSGYYAKRGSHHTWEFEDLDCALGVQVAVDKKGTPVPYIRLLFTEIFPTGHYRNLSPQKGGIEAGGGGSYRTRLGFLASKVFYFFPEHPFRLRFNFYFTIPTAVHVKGFNTYGGGYGTDGRVKPGLSFNPLLSIEYSFTQRIAYAMDIDYTYTNAAHFSGRAGVDADGNLADCAPGYSTLLSLTPSLEYSFTPYLGVIGGLWFTVAGHNSNKFFGGSASVTYTF